MNLTTVVQAPREPTTNPDPIVYTNVPHAEAMRKIRGLRKKTIFLYITIKLPRADAKGSERITKHVVINKPTAINYVRNLGDMAKNECLIPIGECSNCFFLG